MRWSSIPARLEKIEERLFALRAAARKHGVTVAELAAAGREDAPRSSRPSTTARPA